MIETSTLRITYSVSDVRRQVWESPHFNEGRTSIWGRHVQGWSVGSALHTESDFVKMTCHRCAVNLQRTTCATSALDNLLKVYLRSTTTLKPVCLSSQWRQADRQCKSPVVDWHSPLKRIDGTLTPSRHGIANGLFPCHHNIHNRVACLFHCLYTIKNCF